MLLTLRYYATGTFQSVMADMIGVSQPTASRAITRGMSQCFVEILQLYETSATVFKIFEQKIYLFILISHIYAEHTSLYVEFTYTTLMLLIDLLCFLLKMQFNRQIHQVNQAYC